MRKGDGCDREKVIIKGDCCDKIIDKVIFVIMSNYIIGSM